MLRCLRLLCALVLSACAWSAVAQTGLPEASWRAVRAMTKQEHACFVGTPTDADKPVVVMLLSPRMVYSLLEWSRMRQTAEGLGYRVLSWKDPRVPEDEWRMALASPAAKAPDADALQSMPAQCEPLWRGVNHSPMSFVQKGAHFHPWPIWGVMPDVAWRETLEFRLLALQRAPDPSSNR